MELKKYVRKGGNEKERIREGGKKEINNRKEKRRERDRNRVIEQTPEAFGANRTPEGCHETIPN